MLSLRLLLGCLRGCHLAVVLVAYLGRTLRCMSRSCFSATHLGSALGHTSWSYFSAVHLGHILVRVFWPRISTPLRFDRTSRPCILATCLGHDFGHASLPCSWSRVSSGIGHLRAFVLGRVSRVPGHLFGSLGFHIICEKRSCFP